MTAAPIGDPSNMQSSDGLPAVEGAPPRAAKAAAPGRYIAMLAGLTAVGLLGIWQGNKAFAPEMYDRAGSERIASALSAGRNYALFDLNINIREIRDIQIARMKEAPEVAVLGASHWQEAHVSLLPGKRFFNAHVHRDYYEDMLGVTEMFVRHGKLPRQVIIAIRDNLFMPVALRKDYLWLPGVPYYRAMAQRLKLTPHSSWETLPVQHWRELASVQMLYTNAARYYTAPVKPHPTDRSELHDLDVLLPGGSIVWSREHQRLFSPQRAEKLATAFAEANRNAPPTIDPKGVEAIDALLTFLKGRDVEVVLAHPPFNPDFYERIQGTPYLAGLRRVEEVTRQLADRHGLRIVGSFDPNRIGCDEDDYIDAEHANPECLGKLLKQFLALDPAAQQPPVPAVAAPRIEAPRAAHAAAPAPAAGQALSALVPLAAALPAVEPRQAATAAKAGPAEAETTLARAERGPSPSHAAGKSAASRQARPAPLGSAKVKPRSAAHASVPASQRSAGAARCTATKPAKAGATKACTHLAGVKKVVR